MMCRLFETSTSGYHAWVSRLESDRDGQDRALAIETTAKFKAKGRHGCPRIVLALRRKGRKVDRRRNARIMRRECLVARPRWKRRVRTTDSKQNRRIAPNLLARDLSVDAPNKVWLRDITYLATPVGRMYLAAVRDLYSRRVAGWALAIDAQDRARRFLRESRRGAGPRHRITFFRQLH